MRRPRFIAEQARNATGILGRLVAAIMARETRGDNLWAIETLAPAPGERVLDLGTGHGRAIPELAGRVGSAGFVVGTDPSALMVDIAAHHNADLIARGRAELACAPADCLSYYADGFFDRAMAVHVIYFWPSLEPPLQELARVIAPGGTLVLLFRTPDNEHAQAFPTEIYTFRKPEDVISALADAGFDAIEVAPDGPEATTIVVKARRVRPRYATRNEDA